MLFRSLTSSLSGAGTFRTVNADTVVVQGAVDVGTLVTGNGYVQIDSDTAFIGGGNYLGGGFFSGSGVVSIGGGTQTAGTFFIQTGNFNGTGTVRIATGGTLNVSGAGVRGWDIDVAGTWSWTDNDINLLAFPPANTDFVNVLIRPSGVLQMSHAGTARLMSFGGGGSFTNLGTIRKQNGIATTTISGVPIANAGGLMDVVVGTLTIANNCSSLGTVTLNGGSFNGSGCGP